MTIGNFAALTQTNVKRMLAYSSIAHAGYVLVALAARSEIGTAAAMFYLAAYALMNIGAFAVVIHIAGKGERHLKIDDLAGLGQRQPVTAAMLTIFLLSLDRRPSDRRLLRQVLHLPRRPRVQSGLADRARPAQQRRGCLLLPAPAGRDVYVRAGRSR